jgi:hypothetical protein
VSYLERLKGINTQTRLHDGPSKPSKPAFEGFEGALHRGNSGNSPAGDGYEAERAAIIEFDGGVAREWAESLARLECSPSPPGVTLATWRKAIDRAARFCDRWGAIAAAEGWTAGELFGLNPAAPFGRLDMRGAAFIGLDLDVIDVTAEAIVFWAANGAIQRRQGRSLGVDSVLWRERATSVGYKGNEWRDPFLQSFFGSLRWLPQRMRTRLVRSATLSATQ